MGYNTILVPLDGSELAELALKHVPKLANPGAQIHLLSVVTADHLIDIAALATTVGQTVAFTPDQWSPDESARAVQDIYHREAYLNRIAEPLRARGYEVTVEVRPGKAVETIACVALDGFDVIVMATHNRTGLSRWILGSVSEGVLHAAQCPVLMV